MVEDGPPKDLVWGTDPDVVGLGGMVGMCSVVGED